MASATVSLLCLAAFVRYFDAGGILMILTAGEVCFLSYTASAFILGELRKEDILLMTEALNRKRSKKVWMRN